jgi:mannose-6-phosphate isomerase-like protein (cupin superfamily)
MQTPEEFLKTVDRSGFSLEKYVREVPKPWGKELILTPEDSPYTLKLEYINDGAQLSLQVHDNKTETWIMYEGRGKVITENSNGELVEVELERGRSFTSKVGQKHRLVGIENCVIAEASTPEKGITYRLEDDYARPDETEEIRNSPNRGWNG